MNRDLPRRNVSLSLSLSSGFIRCLIVNTQAKTEPIRRTKTKLETKVAPEGQGTAGDNITPTGQKATSQQSRSARHKQVGISLNQNAIFHFFAYVHVQSFVLTLFCLKR